MPTEVTYRDRVRGSIILGAFGDAFGYPIEFLGKNEIPKDYGLEYFLPGNNKGRTFQFSDDTQMTLLAANAILCRLTAEEELDHAPIIHDFAYDMYRRWAFMMNHREFNNSMKSRAWLLDDIPEMSESRHPGNTCMDSLLKYERYSDMFAPHNDSKGCGGVMRVAPYGLMFRDRAYILAEYDASMTHGHPLGWMSAGFQADIIAHIVWDRMSLRESISASLKKLKEIDHKDCDELERKINDTLDYADRSILTNEFDISKIGEGWVAEEALCMAIYACLCTDNVRDMLRMATMHGGDSDSVGSIAGNIWGALYGLESLRGQLNLEHLERYDMIEQIADDLADSNRKDFLSLPGWMGKYHRW